jgi:short-subunit dehydrogenase
VRPDYYAQRAGVITGAGAGIGRALAIQLAYRGATLALWDRDADALSDTAGLCREAGARVRMDVVDVSDAPAVAERAGGVHDEFGRIELVFCVAGVIHTGTVLDSALTDVEHVLNVNLHGTINTVTAFLPWVLSSGGGNIVTTSSAFGLMAAPRYSAYCASKFAIRGFTEALRLEMDADHHPVAVSCVVPGGVRTQIIRNGRFATTEDADAVSDEFDRRVARTTPKDAATQILHGVQRGKARILVGRDARAVSVIARLAGGSYQRILPRLLGQRRDQRPVGTHQQGGGRG